MIRIRKPVKQPCQDATAVEERCSRLITRRTHPAVRKGRKTLVALLTAALAAIMITAANPASAGTCTTPYCGGVVRIPSSAGGNSIGNGVAITNCWNSGGFDYGDSHPCMRNGWSNTSYYAGKYLFRGQTSASYYHYYDVDGFRVFRGCTVRGYWDGGSAFSFYAGSTSMWVRITGTSEAVITSVSC
ncbi:hypothetical protein [Streptomyces sp. NPDC050988]|uniref:hypothetical protein n=1 Tax=Streptomyces sp. NPDC050988 TaxID=3365637 RepID=UPI00378F097B